MTSLERRARGRELANLYRVTTDDGMRAAALIAAYAVPAPLAVWAAHAGLHRLCFTVALAWANSDARAEAVTAALVEALNTRRSAAERKVLDRAEELVRLKGDPSAAMEALRAAVTRLAQFPSLEAFPPLSNAAPTQHKETHHD